MTRLGHGLDQPVLRAEVVEDRRPCDIGAFGNLGHRDVVEAVLREQPDRDVHDSSLLLVPDRSLDRSLN